MNDLPPRRAGAGDLRRLAAERLSAPGAIVAIPDESAELIRAIDRCLRAQAEWLVSEALMVDAVLGDGKRHPFLASPRKGYPEFDPDQPRDELGRWTDGGESEGELHGDSSDDQLAQIDPSSPARSPTDPEALRERLVAISPLLDIGAMRSFAGQFAGENRDMFTAEQREQQRQELVRFLDALEARHPSLEDKEKGTYLTADEKTHFALYYALEGGMQLKGGVTPGLFDDERFIKKLEDLNLLKSRGAITPDNLPAYYRAVEEYMMRDIGGRERLKDIADEKLRIAFIDAQFLDGETGGGGSIRKAVNEVLGDARARGLAQRVRSEGRPSLETFAAYKALANSADPNIQNLLRNALAEARIRYRKSKFKKDRKAEGRIRHLQ